MSGYYGCGLHCTDRATELTVRKETDDGPMMGAVYRHDGQMHAIIDGHTVSVCHTSITTDDWCPEVFTFKPVDVRATNPLDAWNFHCPECGLRGGFADNTFVRRFVAPPERPPIDSYPLFKRWLHNIQLLLTDQRRREQVGEDPV